MDRADVLATLKAHEQELWDIVQTLRSACEDAARRLRMDLGNQ
jgi:hypothetical protein